MRRMESRFLRPKVCILFFFFTFSSLVLVYVLLYSLCLLICSIQYNCTLGLTYLPAFSILVCIVAFQELVCQLNNGRPSGRVSLL